MLLELLALELKACEPISPMTQTVDQVKDSGQAFCRGTTIVVVKVQK